MTQSKLSDETVRKSPQEINNFSNTNKKPISSFNPHKPLCVFGFSPLALTIR